jgi:hypothetical protein
MPSRTDRNKDRRTKPRALLIGKGMISSSKLIATLVTHEWEWEFATSYAEALVCLNTAGLPRSSVNFICQTGTSPESSPGSRVPRPLRSFPSQRHRDVVAARPGAR